MFNILKIIALIIVLAFVYNLLQNRTAGEMDGRGVIQGNQVLQVTDEQLWANASPLRGSVTLSSNGTPTRSDATTEYLVLKAPARNDSAVDMTGWSVHSTVSNTRVYLPPATLMLKMTELNSTEPVHLAPGEYAILHTGHSPIQKVTTSFHTNKCIGYVAEFYNFTPELRSACNDPSTILPATPANVKTYGATCIEFLHQADSCKSYRNEMPAHLLPACRDLIARKLTYHSCLSEGFERDGYGVFNNGGWRLYLGHNAELWRNNYEALRLLDADGLVVDVLRY